MLNVYYTFPNVFNNNSTSSNFIYNITNMFVFFKCTILTHLILLLVTSKKNSFSIVFMYFTHKIQNFELIRFNFVNAGLQNVLSYWHPVCLYIFLFFFFKSYFVKLQNNYIMFLFVTMFICSGSWWSSQEVLWHGWWNWDGVENTLLVLTVYLFLLSHKKFNIKNSYFFQNFILITIFLNFFVLNKTGIFKSIHSFTSSTYSNISYFNFIYIFIYINFFLYSLRFKKLLFFYNILLSLPFFFFLVFSYYLIFSKVDFFMYLNFLFFSCLLINKIGLLFFVFIFLLPSFKLLLVLLFFLNTFIIKTSVFRFLHLVAIFVIMWFLCVLFKQNSYFFLTELGVCKHFKNYNIINKLIYRVDLNSSWFSVNFTSVFMSLYKNLNNVSKNYFLDFLVTETNHVFFFYKIIYLNIFNISLVTKVFYSKQKPRYNY